MIDPFTFVTPTASADGYGHAGEMLALAAVREHGADVQVVGHDWADERYCDPAFLALKVPEAAIPDRRTVVVFFLPYALARFRSERTVSMTMWETDRLPDVWARLLGDLADGIVVPSEHCAAVFGERVDRPIEVVPFGTDTAFYRYVDRDPRETCQFLMSGLLHYRKGVEFALRAFREEFAPEEPVTLVLKTRRSFLDVGSEAGVLADPRVAIVDRDFTRAEMRTLYEASDCFLAPSRGEGSGLTPRDAMATGLPVIVHDWGGLSELADPRCAYVVPTEDLELAPAENSSYGAGVTGGGDIGNFGRPSVPALRAAMREVFEDREAAYARGREASAWMRRDFSWGRCAERWLQAVEKLSAGVAA